MMSHAIDSSVELHDDAISKEQKLPKICNVCSKQFKRESHLICHIRSHTGERPFSCDFDGCDKSFKRKDQLTRHQCTHTGNRRHLCSYSECYMTFTTSAQLKRHQETHFKEIPFACPICDLRFVLRTELRKHKLELHGLPDFVCDLDKCNLIFISQSKLDRHKLSHDRRFICAFPGCFMGFSSVTAVQKHMESDHDKTRQINTSSTVANEDEDVDEDEDEGADGDKAADEMTSIHAETETVLASEPVPADNSLSIDRDPRATKRRRQWDSSGQEVDCWCPMMGCEKQFANPGSLRSHMIARHSSQQPYACTFPGCGRRFGYANVLQRHNLNVHHRKQSVESQPLPLSFTQSHSQSPPKSTSCLPCSIDILETAAV